MTHDKIDGMVVVAQLKRGVIRGAIYKDVTIRKDDGDVRRLGTLLASTDMKQALVPGSRGRFYVYDVLGSKGIYGHRPLGGKAHGRFPTRWTLGSMVLGILNLMVALGWTLTEGKVPILSTSFGIIGIGMGILFFAVRNAAMGAYRQDDARAPTAGELRAIDARA